MVNPTKTGYVFDGWFESSGCSGTAVTTIGETAYTEDIILYAKWTYSITYNGNGNTGGTAPTDSKNHLAGSNVTILGNTGSLEKTGYTFDGWNTQADGNGNTYAVGATVNNGFASGDTTLYANWKANTYNIIYKDEGGGACTATTNTSPTKHVYDSVTILTDPTKTSASTTKGYEFAGWYKDSACSDDKKVTSLAATDYTDNITLYAKWRGWVQLWSGGPKWAEFNIGSTITDYASATGTTNAEKYTTANIGGYYEWGGTTDKDSKTAAGTNFSNSTKDIQGKGTIGTDTLGDTARLKWGSNWVMPTKSQFNALVAGVTISEGTGTGTNTIWTWCDGLTSGGTYNRQYVSGCTLAGWKVSGRTGTDYEDNSIFLPAAGSYYSDLYNRDTDGYYWSSTPNDTDNDAFRLGFTSSSKNVVKFGRHYGFSVRAVLK